MSRPARPHPYHKVITRWVKGGKQVAPHTPGARKVHQRTSTYYADIPGTGTRTLGTSDRQVAWKRLNDLLRAGRDAELGIVDGFTRHAPLPLDNHLDAWLDVLEAKGTATKQRGLIRARLKLLFDLAGWQRLGQIDADSTVKALASLQNLKTAKRSRYAGRGAQTRNHYLTHLKAFCAWCVASDRLRKNPAHGVERVSVEIDPRHQRREPSSEEVAALFRYLSADASVRRGLTPESRAMAYKVALATGYRAGEMRLLERAGFDLDRATVFLAAKAEKARRGDIHPLPGWLVNDLRAWFESGGRLWNDCHEQQLGRVLRDDLAAARLAWIGEAGSEEEARQRRESNFLRYETVGVDGSLFWDFHSLRVWYISELAAQPGMDLKTLITLARHKTPHLSLKVYAKKRESNLRAATERLPRPL